MQQSKLIKIFYQLHADEFAALKIFIKKIVKIKIALHYLMLL